MEHELSSRHRLLRKSMCVLAVILTIHTSQGFFFASGASAIALPPITRQEMITRAKKLAGHRWVCRNANRVAACVTQSPYACDWKADEQVIGLPYDWGGMDDIDRFNRKLLAGQAAGSHKRHGITVCTAGIDCSGFVSYCWGQPLTHQYSTSTIRTIGAKPRYNVFTDMKPGDALVKPGVHIVLFAGYRADGNPDVYEASGSKGKVVFNNWSSWSAYKGFYPLQYKMVMED